MKTTNPVTHIAWPGLFAKQLLCCLYAQNVMEA